ncbi:hypothetical protein JYU34_003716 [Plutella xylostella]|uniref:Lipase domain-containing protein n=1 Tax=Plutella xylostella TaxID=51655 RepID=A0ABQ7R0R1_PLUXY|nr:hypothetical protein JYU34_003716 [Plutella xylostella]
MAVLVRCAVLLLATIAAASSRQLQAQDVVFHLFTRNNPTVSQPLSLTEAAILASTFNDHQRTMITIHDHSDAIAGNFNAFVVPAELKAYDVNVIAVDWSAAAGSSTEGIAYAPQVAAAVAELMDFLVDTFEYDHEGFRLIGFGIGAHIAGIAARKARADIVHIVALDPAFNGWSHHPYKLSWNAAECVEVLHTTAGIIGYDRPMGHMDFYPNAGSFQNGCGSDSACSHQLAYVYYAESLTAEVEEGNRFWGTKCESYEDAVLLQCNGEKDNYFGGRALKNFNFGIYTFITNSASPFARG